MSKFTIHNALTSPSVNGYIQINQGLVVGGPLIGGGSSPIPISEGVRVLVVDPDGTTGLSNYATIQSAIDAASSGDVIYVQPGTYAENLTVTTDYVTIVGSQLGGYGRPDVQPASGTTSTLTVTAQGFVCVRMRFVSPDNGADAHVVTQRGNGFRYIDCVFDGGSTNGATNALLRLKGSASDDSYTASEGEVVNCLFRESEGFAIAFEDGDAPGNGVGSTHCVISGCRFIDNGAADVVTRDSGTGGTYSVQDVLLDRCYFMEPKNKATWIDFTTSNAGAAGVQTGMISDCYFNDDTVDTTAVAIVGTGVGVVGCHSMDGEFDGSGLD